MTLEVYAFKVKNYSTILFGQKETMNVCDCTRCKERGITNTSYFYVQRADGEKYKYHEDEIEWSDRLIVYQPNLNKDKEELIFGMTKKDIIETANAIYEESLKHDII